MVGFVERSRNRAVLKYAAVASLTTWLIFAMVGLDRLTTDALKVGAFTRRAWMDAYVKNVREFLQTNDASALTAKPFPFQVPFGNPPMLVNAWLRHPYVRQILPAAIRVPLRLEPSVNGPFVVGGAYPTTPTDDIRPSRGSFNALGNPAEGRFETQAAVCEVATHLRFEVAGYLSEPGLSLLVKDVSSGRETAIDVRELAKERWVGARIRCPGGPFIVAAADARPDLWFAFREPVEIGWASSIAEWLIERARALLLASLALCVLALRWT
jgi:hypothetical protein